MVSEPPQTLGPGPLAAAVLVVAGFIVLANITYGYITGPDGKATWPTDANGWAWLGLSVFYLIFAESWIIDGFRSVKAEEIAVVSLFGKPLVQRRAGLLFAPAPWTIRVEPTLPIEEVFPPTAENEQATARPVLITHGTLSTPSTDPLDNRLTTSVRIIVRYRITDLIQFSQNVGTVDQARNRLRDTVVTIAQAECGRRTVGMTLSSLPEVNRSLTEATRLEIADWGVALMGVVLQDIDLGGSITDAMRNASVSIINLETNRNNAQQRLFEGQAAAEVHKAFQYAKAEGYKTIARELGVDEPVVLFQIETLANMWRRNNADINLYGGELGEVFKMVTAFSRIVDASKDAPGTPQLPS